MKNVPEKLKRIAMCHAPEHRVVLLEICRELKRRFNSEIHVYCALNQQVSFYDEAIESGYIASAQCRNALQKIDLAAKRDADEVFTRAAAYEKLLGTTYNRLIMADRHYGRAYSLGGFYHPRSHMSEVDDYCAIVDAYTQQLDFWQGEFDKHDFTLVMYPTIELGYLAESKGVEMRCFLEAGQGNLYMWVDDRYDQSLELDEVFERTIAEGPQNIFGTYGPNDALMRMIDKDVQIGRMLHKMLMSVARQFYWRLRGHDKAKSYFLTERIKGTYLLNKQMREVRRLATTKLADLEGQRFVFYPLHEEPEIVLTIGAPERIDQMGAIASIARDLPAGVKLVVKETYFGVGRRPDNFYQQIADFKNVVFMDMTERGLEVARASEAVVTIRGTVGQEGAILGKPVILLARNAPYKCVPHVRLSQREEELKPLLEWALDGSFDGKRALIDGARFYNALSSICIDMEEYSYLDPDDFPRSAIGEAVDAMVRSVNIDRIRSSVSAETHIPIMTTSRAQ